MPPLHFFLFLSHLIFNFILSSVLLFSFFLSFSTTNSTSIPCSPFFQKTSEWYYFRPKNTSPQNTARVNKPPSTREIAYDVQFIVSARSEICFHTRVLKFSWPLMWCLFPNNTWTYHAYYSAVSIITNSLTCVNSVCYRSMCLNSSYMLVSRRQNLRCSASPLLNWSVKAKAQCTRSDGTGAHCTTILPHTVPLLDVKAGNGERGYGPVFYVHTQPIPSDL
jgi:hypothetical protein